ncbi:MAG: type VI secretion system tip protein VgrG [Polyangiaceae bacterium]|nr:type VI secretion system tip protein VgrG [Polyangiaceae bacterium]
MQVLPTDSAQTFDLQLLLPGASCRVRSCDIEEGLSELGGARLRIAMTDDFDFEPLLDETATLVFTLGGVPIRRFTFKVESGSFVELAENALIFEIVLKPALHFLRYGKDIRKFRDLTTEAIVSKILDDNGVAHRWQTTRPCPSRPYTVQYRETHLDFVTRLLEHEGIYFTFDQDGTLVLSDDSRAADLISGKSWFELVEGDGALAHGEAGITSVHRGTVMGTGKATVNDHDWKKPSLSLLKSSTGARDTALEVYDYPTGYRDPSVGATLARLRVEAFEAEKRFIEGTSTVPFFEVGRKLELAHEEAASFSGTYLLRRVTHHYEQQSGQSQGARYGNDFKAIFADTPFRPPLATPRPVIQGNHTVRVRGPEGEEIHTDPYGRAKVQFHWDREAKGTDEDSRWIRVVQETSSSMQLARVGWELSVSYIDGDPDRPVGTSRLINGQMMPTYAQPGFKNRMTIKTESYPGKQGYNELRLDDSAAEMTMDWHAQKDLMGAVEHDRREKVGRDYRHLIDKGLDRAVEKSQELTIGRDEIVDLGRGELEVVKLDRSETVGANESIDVKDSATLMVRGNDKESVGALRFTMSGGFGVSIPEPKEIMKKVVASSAEAYTKAFKLELESQAKGALGGPPAAPMDLAGTLKGGLPSAESLASEATGGLSDVRSVEDLADKLVQGSIMRATSKRHLRLVGGALVELAGKTIVNAANKLYVEAVGGVKLTATATHTIQRSVAKLYSTTVGGVILRKAKGDVSTASKKSTITVGGATLVESSQKLELHGKEIEIEASEAFSLKAGGLGIELSTSGAKITGELKLKAGTSVKVGGGPDNLT